MTGKPFKHFPILAESGLTASLSDDTDFQYVSMPQAMRTFAPPVVQAWHDIPETRAALSRLADGLAANLQGLESPVIDLLAHGLDTRKSIGEILGEGEINILADFPVARLDIVESVFAGVWVIQQFRNGCVEDYYLETGPCPKILSAWTASKNSPPEFPAAFPDGLMNAPALLHEVFVKSEKFTPGNEEIINLTLLPMTAEDMAFMVESLGSAGVSIIAKGYGDCHITLTLQPNVWWVRYYNSTGQLILNTLEITALPNVVMAAPEDLEDSASRLAEVLAGME